MQLEPDLHHRSNRSLDFPDFKFSALDGDGGDTNDNSVTLFRVTQTAWMALTLLALARALRTCLRSLYYAQWCKRLVMCPAFLRPCFISCFCGCTRVVNHPVWRPRSRLPSLAVRCLKVISLIPHPCPPTNDDTAVIIHTFLKHVRNRSMSESYCHIPCHNQTSMRESLCENLVRSKECPEGLIVLLPDESSKDPDRVIDVTERLGISPACEEGGAEGGWSGLR